MDAATESFLVFAVLCGVFAVSSLLLNRMLGAKRVLSYLQDTTYECGEEAEGEAQIDFPSHHYVYAIVFVAVDVMGFVLALWAVSLRALVFLNEWIVPTVIVGVFTMIAMIGIYYVLRGEKSLWV